MASQTQKDKPVWTMPQRLCLAWIAGIAVISFVAIMDVGNVMVHDDQMGTLVLVSRLCAIVTIACGFFLARPNRQTSKPPHFGRIVVGYASMILCCGALGAAAAFHGVPRVSLLMSQTQMSLNTEFYKISKDTMDRRTERNFIRRWGWQFRHPNHEVYDMQIDSYRTPVLRTRTVSLPDRHDVRISPGGRGGPAVPTSVTLHGVGNSFAMRVFDFTVVAESDNG